MVADANHFGRGYRLEKADPSTDKQIHRFHRFHSAAIAAINNRLDVKAKDRTTVSETSIQGAVLDF